MATIDAFPAGARLREGLALMGALTLIAGCAAQVTQPGSDEGQRPHEGAGPQRNDDASAIGSSTQALIPASNRCADEHPALASRMRRVAIRMIAPPRRFARAVRGGGDSVRFDRDAIHSHETFHLVDNDDGTVALLANNCEFVSPVGGGGGAVVANRNRMGAWERFRTYRFGHYVSFRTSTGHYLTPGSTLRADATRRQYFWIAELEGDRQIVLDASDDGTGVAYHPLPGLGVGDEIYVDRSYVTTWDLIELGFGEVALRSNRGRYLRADGGGGDDVDADRTGIGLHERYLMGGDGEKFWFQTWDGHYLDHDVVFRRGLFVEDGPIISARTTSASDEHALWHVRDVSDAREVALDSVSHDRYVIAVPGGEVKAEPTVADAWETFRMVDMGRDGDGNQRVALRTHFDTWLYASGSDVDHRALSWRPMMFTLLEAGGDRVALRASNGRYVRVVGSVPNAYLRADATSISTAALFELTDPNAVSFTPVLGIRL